MKRKKGFTLIELLAVIVILAIIALIAVPVVMNIIAKANKSAFKDSAYGIIKAGELFYSNELLKQNGMEEDITFTFPNNIEGLEINGSKPTGGAMAINKKGEVALAIMNGKYCAIKKYDEDNIIINEDINTCKNTEIPILSQLITTGTFTYGYGKAASVSEEDLCAISGTCKIGTPFAIKVNDVETYIFYVISDKDDKVTLIMDRNLYNVEDLSSGTHNLQWVNSQDFGDDEIKNIKGPLTALKALKHRTSSWENIPKYSYSLELKNENGDNSRYTTVTGEMVENVRARLPEYSELAALGTIGNYGIVSTANLPDYLYQNLNYRGDKNTEGYWTSTPYSYSKNETAWQVGWSSGLHYGSGTITNQLGIRPVITLDK